MTVFDAQGAAHEVVFFAGTEEEVEALPGSLRNNLVVGPDGTTYAVTVKQQDSDGGYNTNFAVIGADGSVRLID